MQFDGTITLGHIIQAAAFLGAGAAVFFKLDKRIALVQAELKHVWREIRELPCHHKHCEIEKE